ncbi:hypothetical protein OQA88_9704 [Cercophora sp. LCS_1]
MKFLAGAVAFAAGMLMPSSVMAAPPVMQRDVELEIRNDIEPRLPPGSCHTPSNRACWATGFNINTDYESVTPPSGTTRKYTLTLTEEENWVGPDGVAKAKVMLVNGNILGPTIVADWGDFIEVKVINNLDTNGTSIHWHGLHQKLTQLHDGANGVTECPIPPGGEFTYKFRAQQYGSSWYHSHFSAQYGNGIVGTILINGPASLPYDIDLGVFPITDYYYKSADELVHDTMNGPPPPSDNVLFNGKGKHPITGAGEWANVTLTPGKRHRLRIINTSTENHFQLSLVNHQFTIIASDLVPVNAFTTQSLFLGVGQRYDVTIDASQTPGNYWFNVTFGGNNACGWSLNPHPAAIFHYAGAPGGLPTNPGTAPLDHQCTDLINLSPVVPRNVPVNTFVKRPANTLPVHLQFSPGQSPLFVWQINGSAIDVDWDKPVVDYLLTNNTSYPSKYNLVHVDDVDAWTYWLIENDDPTGIASLPHPFHLHGHDFVVLGRSPDQAIPTTNTYVFNQSQDIFRLNGNNPIRRDVAMLPARGWLLIAFKTNNPGAWLMHCHIAWHVSGGLSVDFLERANDFRNQIGTADRNAFNQNCAAWRTWWATAPFPKGDSGLKA